MTARKGVAGFVKSADTRSPVSNSRVEVDKMLKRYGATAISVAEDVTGRRIAVTFTVPNTGDASAHGVPVRLMVSVYAVYDALYGQPTKQVRNDDPSPRAPQWLRVRNAAGYNQAKLQQAERVAWRNLALWLDAALSSAAIGLQTITETFFAHAVVGAGGERMIEVVERAQAELGAGVQRLLTSTTEASDVG